MLARPLKLWGDWSEREDLNSAPGSRRKQVPAERSLRSFEVKESDVVRRAVWRNADIAVLLALRYAARRPPPHHAKIARVGDPGPAAQGRNRFLASPALALQLAKARLGTVPGYYQPSRFAGLELGATNGMESHSSQKTRRHGAPTVW